MAKKRRNPLVRKGYTKVQFGLSEVRDFKKRWPNSRLPDDAVTLTINANGDLVDALPASVLKTAEPEAVAAMLAAARLATQAKPNESTYYLTDEGKGNPSPYPRVMAAFRRAGMSARLVDTGGGVMNILAPAFGFSVVAHGRDDVFPESDREPFWKHHWEVSLLSPHHGDPLQTWSTPNIENFDEALGEAFREARRRYAGVTKGGSCSEGCASCAAGERLDLQKHGLPRSNPTPRVAIYHVGDTARLKRFTYTKPGGGTGLSWGQAILNEEPFVGDATVRVTDAWKDYETGWRYHGTPVSKDLIAFMRKHARRGSKVHFDEFEILEDRSGNPVDDDASDCCAECRAGPDDGPWCANGACDCHAQARKNPGLDSWGGPNDIQAIQQNLDRVMDAVSRELSDNLTPVGGNHPLSRAYDAARRARDRGDVGEMRSAEARLRLASKKAGLTLHHLGRSGNPSCTECDCADPTAMHGLAQECDCRCHGRKNPGRSGEYDHGADMYFAMKGIKTSDWVKQFRRGDRFTVWARGGLGRHGVEWNRKTATALFVGGDGDAWVLSDSSRSGGMGILARVDNTLFVRRGGVEVYRDAAVISAGGPTFQGR